MMHNGSSKCFLTFKQLTISITYGTTSIVNFLCDAFNQFKAIRENTEVWKTFEVLLRINIISNHILFLYVLLSALGLWIFIRRGKQCLDFTVTVHFFHMIGCWIYNSHLPAALSWWLVNVACIALMAVIGEYLCMRTELRAIPVNTGPKSNL